MGENKIHFRHLMLFYYRKGKNAIQTTNKIRVVYGESALTETTVRKWFARFKASDFNLKDKERSGRPPVIDDEQITKTLIENNQRYTIRELAKILKISKTTVHKHLKKLGSLKIDMNFLDNALSIQEPVPAYGQQKIHFQAKAVEKSAKLEKQQNHGANKQKKALVQGSNARSQDIQHFENKHPKNELLDDLKNM